MPSDHKMLISRYLWYNGARTISEKGELSSSITEAHESASQAYGFSIVRTVHSATYLHHDKSLGLCR